MTSEPTAPSRDQPLDDRPLTVDELAEQERALQLTRLTEDDAWDLGCALVAEARRRDLAVTIDVTRGTQQLFHAARPGTAADNDAWVLRKARVVRRFGHSSLYVGQLCRDAGRTLQEMFALPDARYAAHGGSFPLAVRDVGLVGTVTVSGLPQRQDHALVVQVLGEHLRR